MTRIESSIETDPISQHVDPIGEVRPGNDLTLRDDLVADFITLSVENFRPVIRYVQNSSTPKETAIWDASTRLAWKLRQADHQRQSGDENAQATAEYQAITQFMNERPEAGTYLAYQLLSDSFETEADLRQEDKNLDLKPLSEELRTKAVDRLIRATRAAAGIGQDSDTFVMVNNVLNRSTEYVAGVAAIDVKKLKPPYAENPTPIGSSYLTVPDLDRFIALAEELKDNSYATSALQPVLQIDARRQEDEDMQAFFKSPAPAETPSK